jgi:hypothetical protein
MRNEEDEKRILRKSSGLESRERGRIVAEGAEGIDELPHVEA